MNMQSDQAEWEKLASTARWRGVIALIRNWVGPMDCSVGMSSEKLDAILRRKKLALPTAVREWRLLADRWRQGGTTVWRRAKDMVASDGRIPVLGDTEGITCWEIRTEDVGHDDPPVIRFDDERDGFASFSLCVAAMIINDIIFGNYDDQPITVNLPTARRALSSLNTEFFTDAPLESASVVMFASFSDGLGYCKARTLAGRALLEQLQSGHEM